MRCFSQGSPSSLLNTSSSAAFSESDFRNILAFGGAINAVLLLGALFLLRFSRVIANAILSLIVLAGVATAYIIHTDLYLVGNKAVLVSLCVAFGVALFVAFRVMDELRWGGVVLSAAALLGLGIIAGGHLTTGDEPAEGDVTNIRDISFRETPNLYFVSFDSIAPRSLLSKYLGVTTTEFHDVFDAHFRRFPNFFANAVSTTNSLNSLMSLDMDVYHSQRKVLAERGDDPNPFLFSGQNPSPLLSILQRNGYVTTSIYSTTYFGKKKGPYIDDYITIQNHTICNLLDAVIRNIAFWGYCRFSANDVSGFVDNGAVVEQITEVNTNDRPHFVIAHIYEPGHTDRSFRYDDTAQLQKFKTQYINGSKGAARHLELIVRHLKRSDPNAILFVYGDHGPFLSRGLEFEDNREFVVQDHFGILGGVYPRDACAAWFDDASAQEYMTILDAVHAILRCLSGGESARIKPQEYKLIVGYDKIPWGANLDYKEFSYE